MRSAIIQASTLEIGLGYKAMIVTGDRDLRLLLDKIYRDRGFDFRQYREKSIRRRLERRLHATRTESYRAYMAVLDRDGTEYDKLLDVLTINVTEFFRDPEAFDTIETTVLPAMVSFARTTGQNAIHIWSAGCATGEEPYSIAMLISEILAEKIKDFHVAICATDIDKDSLLKAKEGRYEAAAVARLKRELVGRYFTRNDKYGVSPEIKALVEFREHNLVSDDPLAGLDLIICRNVAIYLSRELQERVFMNFYTGLREGGFLFLGKAETLPPEALRLFDTVDKRWRIYQKSLAR